MRSKPLNTDSIKRGVKLPEAELRGKRSLCLFISHSICSVSLSIDMKSAGPRIVSAALNLPSPPADNSATDPFIITVKKSIIAFLDGRIKDLSDLPIDLSFYTPFARQTLLAARSIPWGKAVSYAGLAEMAGNPGAARAAASVMRNNPLPLIIPCHRVIRSDGSAGGFMGKREGREVELKVRLLAREGILLNK